MTRCFLQSNYSSFEEFKSYSEMYGLHTRLGFSSPESAWEKNPYISIDVDPAKYKVIPKLVLPNGATYGYGNHGEKICTGSQMGRRDVLPDDKHLFNHKLRLERLPFVDGAYDKWGAYWGSPVNVWCAWFPPIYEDYTEEKEIRVFVRANNREEAKRKVKELLPNVTFYR